MNAHRSHCWAVVWTGDGAGGFQQGDFQINPVLAEDCGQTHRKIAGHTLDQLAVIDVYEKFEVHAAYIVAKVRVCDGVSRGVGCGACRKPFL